MGATRVAERVEAQAPREHGAWVMLALPLMLGAAVGGLSGRHALLTVAALAVFLGQDLIRRRVRGRLAPSSVSWLAACGAVAVVSGAALLLLVPPAVRLGLLALGAVGGAIFLALLWALARPGGKRFDRSVVGELLAVPALTLTGPAAVMVGGGTATQAATVWALSVAWFGGGMLFVKMLLDGWKRGRRGLAVHRSPLAVGTLGLHAATLAALAVSPMGTPWLALAYLPAVARALWGFSRLGRPLPRLMTLGIAEAALAVVFFCAALI